MVPWIQIYSNVATHEKVFALAERLKIQSYSAVGIMVSLWCFAAINAPNGELGGYSKKAVAAGVSWNKKPEVLFDALVYCGLLDIGDEGEVSIHNWERYAMLLMDILDDQKKKTCERVKKYRQKKMQRTDEQETECNVTVTLRNASTPPDNTEQEIKKISVGDGDTGEALDRKKTSLAKKDPLDGYVGMTEALKRQLWGISVELFLNYFGRGPVKADVATVLECIVSFRPKEDGEFLAEIDHDKKEILEYAFEQAQSAGNHSLSYVKGVLLRLSQRGLKTLDDCISYDFDRDKQNRKI